MLDYRLALIIKCHISKDGFITLSLSFIIFFFSSGVVFRLPIHNTIVCILRRFFLHRLHFIHNERFHSTSHLLPLLLLSIFDHDCLSVFCKASLLLWREWHWWIIFGRQLDRFVSVLVHNIYQVVAVFCACSLIHLLFLVPFCNGRFLAFRAISLRTKGCDIYRRPAHRLPT